VPPPPQVDTAPPPGGAQAPPAPAPSTPSAPGQAAGALPTLVPPPSDPATVDEVVLPGKPVALMQGSSTWDDGFKNLVDAFQTIGRELDKAGIKPAGRPLTIFVETDDLSFRYQAMIPIDQAPDDKVSLTPEVRFGTTPSGKALRFIHKAPYDDIDNTYEAITAYLDAKGITVQDSFIEEYITDLTDSADPNLAINVYVQPK
jgi:effector-binding domain-containing protein